MLNMGDSFLFFLTLLVMHLVVVFQKSFVSTNTSTLTIRPSNDSKWLCETPMMMAGKNIGQKQLFQLPLENNADSI